MPTLRPIGISGLLTPPLVLGGNVFGWTCPEAEARGLLDRFAEAGGTMIDTADVYSAWAPGHKGGESETVLGRWAKGRGGWGGMQIATKVGMLPGEGGAGLRPERIRRAVEASLDRLGADRIDLYYAHKDDPDTPLDETLDAFRELVETGLVRALGASNYSAERLADALAICKRRGWPAYSVLQPELSLVKRSGFSGALQQLAIEEGLGVLTYFPLASGYLTGKYRATEDLAKSQRSDRAKALMDGAGPKVLAAMDDVAAETGASLAQIALAWNARQPGVTAPIASATSLAQLDELLGSLALELTEEHMERLDAAAL